MPSHSVDRIRIIAVLTFVCQGDVLQHSPDSVCTTESVLSVQNWCVWVNVWAMLGHRCDVSESHRSTRRCVRSQTRSDKVPVGRTAGTQSEYRAGQEQSSRPRHEVLTVSRCAESSSGSTVSGRTLFSKSGSTFSQNLKNEFFLLVGSRLKW